MKSVRLIKITVMAERHKEQPVQQLMSAMLMTFTARKKLTILFKQCDYNI